METQPFLDWHVARTTRKTGRAPARTTLKTKASKLRTCASVMGVDGLEFLATTIQTRQGVETLLDRLALTQSPGAMRTTLDALKDFSAYCEVQGWPTPPLTAADRPGANPQKSIVVYTEMEVATLLGHARAVHGPRWELFLETLAGTGRRVGEVLGLEWAWLNLTADPPHFHLPNTKNGKQAYVPLDQRLTCIWEAGIQVSELRLGFQFGRDPATYPFPWTHSCAHKMFVRYCRRLGVESRGFHCFRHTKATEMLARGVPLQAVSALMGHANVATTDRIYNHTSALSYAHYLG